MSNLFRAESKESHLNESWVEVLSASRSSTPPFLPNGVLVTPEMMEKLLLEAQNERNSNQVSVNHSMISSRASPKSPQSPCNSAAPPTPSNSLSECESDNKNVTAKKFTTNDWIWDWQSRPEIKPPSELSLSSRMRRPIIQTDEIAKVKRHPLSIRNTSFMTTLSTLVWTHAATFLLGAATMYLFMRKFASSNKVSSNHYLYY